MRHHRDLARRGGAAKSDAVERAWLYPSRGCGFTAGYFLLLTVKAILQASICGVRAIVSIIGWMWDSDPAPTEPIHIGCDIVLPTYTSGALSHSGWAMVILMLVVVALYLS